MSSKPSTEALNSQPFNTAFMSSRRALLIVNPNSRRGGEADIQAVIDLLEESGFEVLHRESTSPAQCAQALEEHSGDADLVIIAGGDGTVSSAAEFLYRNNKPLAVLPLGTANDLARSLSIPDDLPSAGRLIVDNHLRRIDVGVVNGNIFLNAVNVGLGTEVTHNLSAEVKKSWGAFSYLKALWTTLSRKNAFRVKISVDGRTYRQRSIHLTVGNGRYYGGGNVVDHDAEIDSGMLCLYSIKPQPIWKLVFMAPLLRLGRQRLNRRTLSESGRRIEIITSKPLEVHADGELVTHTPAKLEVIPHALSVYAPPKRNSMLESLADAVST